MAVRIIDLQEPDDEGLIFHSPKVAEQVLALMIQNIKAKGFRVEKRDPVGEVYPRFTVMDPKGNQISLYTISLLPD